MVPTHKRYEELPDGRGTYQRFKYKRGRQFVEDRGVFVDIGAHVGLWSFQAELDFREIIAFEPCPEHFECYPLNMRTERWTLHKVALGSKPGRASLGEEAHSTGGTHLVRGSDVEVRTLDSYQLERVDLMKIDVEGSELDVVKGGRETLLRCKPVLILEQKGREVRNFGRKDREALRFCLGLGMRELCPPYSGDFFLGW